MINLLGQYLQDNPHQTRLWVALLAVLSFFNVPVGWAVGVVIAFITLKQGPKTGAVLLAWVALLALSLFFLHRAGTPDFLFINCVVIWLMAVIFRRHEAWVLLLELSALCAIVLVALIHFWVPQLDAIWHKLLIEASSQIAHMGALGISAKQLQEFLLRFVKPIATGMVVVLLWLKCGFSLMWARWWQLRLRQPQESFSIEFARLRFSRWVACLAAVVCLAAAVLRWPVLIDMVPVWVFLFVLSGFAVLHDLSARLGGGYHFLVVGVYGCALVFGPEVALVVALLGFVNSWVPVRQYLDHSGENS